MARTEWSPGLQIGIAAIDEQHHKLLDLLNEVQRLAAEGNSSFEEIDDIFEALEAYIASHFRDEEALMERIGYEFLAQHREEHRDLARQVAENREAYSRGTMNAQDLYEWLLRWLLKHIAGSDSLIPMFVARHGLTV